MWKNTLKHLALNCGLLALSAVLTWGIICMKHIGHDITTKLDAAAKAECNVAAELPQNVQKWAATANKQFGTAGKNGG